MGSMKVAETSKIEAEEETGGDKCLRSPQKQDRFGGIRV